MNKEKENRRLRAQPHGARSSPEAQAVSESAANAGQTNRREELLERAGELMAARGYKGTSMRELAAAVGMLPGSIYYYFPSKEALFLELHARVVARMTERVQTALAPLTDPWERFEAACVAHLEGLIETGNLVAIVTPGFLDERAEASAAIRAERSRYEQIFRDLVAALPLADGVDRGVFRLLVFGALNWVPTWYDPKGPRRPDEIARTLTHLLRAGSSHP